MGIFLISLVILALSAIFLGFFALLPPHALRARCINVAGPAVIILGCAVGLWGLVDSPWEAVNSGFLPWGLPFGSGSLGLDSLSRIFLLPVFGLGAVCALAGCGALAHYPAEEHNPAAHWFFFTLLILALALVMTARDAVLFMLAWELMSLAPFFLIDFDDNEQEVRQASWIYLVAAHLGAVFLMALFALLWQQADATTFSAFSQLGSGSLGSTIFVLALLGFGAKAGLAPFHVWLPEAHPVAPSHISALLSGAMINAGLYGIMRTLDFLGPLHAVPAWWGWAVLALGLTTGLVGIFKASAQSNIKRLLAYSSVENMGIMLMALGAGMVGAKAGNAWIATLGFTASLFHMLNHAAFKGLLFLCAGEILHAVHSVRLEHLGGLQKKLPLLGIFFGMGAAAIACLPPFNGFASELVLALSLAGGMELASMEQQLGLLGALVGLALISGLAAATFAKAYGMAFLGEARTGAAQNPAPTPRLAMCALAIPAGACIVLSLAAPQVFTLLSPTALALQHTGAAPTAGVFDVVVSMTNILHIIVAVGLGGVALTLALTAWRAARNQRCALRRGPTWGCGFQGGTARIQYTGASFSEPLAKLFGSGMGLKTRLHMDKGFFPARASLSVNTADRLLTHVFTPLFEKVAQLCDMLKIVQHGRIHLYILYMLATVVALLVWGLHA